MESGAHFNVVNSVEQGLKKMIKELLVNYVALLDELDSGTQFDSRLDYSIALYIYSYCRVMIFRFSSRLNH